MTRSRVLPGAALRRRERPVRDRTRRLPPAANSDLLLALLVLVTGVALVVAWQAEPGPSAEQRIAALQATVRCPSCQGESIADSSAPLAGDLRSAIRRAVESGRSDDQIRAGLVESYGPSILLAAAPAAPDVTLLLAAVVAAMGAGLIVLGRRDRRPAPSRPHREVTPEVERTSSGERHPARSGARAVRGPGVALALVVLVAIGTLAIVWLDPAGRVAPPAGYGFVDPLQTIRTAEREGLPSPLEVATLTALGDARLALGDQAQAFNAYAAALEDAPTSTRALMGVATALLAWDRPAEAIPVYDRLLELDPADTDALLFRAVARLGADGMLGAAAQDDLRRFLALAPEDPKVPMAQRLLEKG